MADTNFVAQNTTIVAAWLNQVNLAVMQGRSPNMATTTGAADAQILTLATGSLYTARVAGDTFGFIAGFTNTGAATLQIVAPGGSLAAAALEMNGAALTGGEVIAGQPYVVGWDGTAWQLVSLAGTPFGTSLLQTANAAAAATLIGAIAKSLLTATGDVIYASAPSTPAALPIGTEMEILGINNLGTLPAWRSDLGPAKSTGQNITGQNNATNPNYQFDWNADLFVVSDSNGSSVKLTTVDVTVDITASGANGLDTGSEANSTWYYGHIIYNPTTDTVAGLLSLSWTSPTLPSGYTFSAPIGAVYNASDGNFRPCDQDGLSVLWRTYGRVVSSGTESSPTATSVGSFAPPIFKLATVQASARGTVGASGSASSWLNLGITSTTVFSQPFIGVANALFSCGASFNVVNKNSGAFYYYFTPTTNVGSIAIDVDILGFTLPIGGQ